ncbi:MAG: hypothetical protein C0404_14570 [Verrucomicrobia bacterium]|nr:hypothetical protein [Verrucomicrobiota bacterium]
MTWCAGLFAAAACLYLAAPAAAQDNAAEPAAAVQDKAPAVEPAKAAAASDDIRKAPKRLKDYNLPGLQEKFSLKTTVPWDVVQLIDFIAQKGGLNNMVLSKGVAGTTSKFGFDNVAVADALEVVFSVNGLAYEVSGGIITIMTDQEYTLKNGTGFYDHKKVKIVDLKFADATRVQTMLDKVRSGIGLVVADPLTGTLILIDTPEKIAEMQAVIAKADISTIARVMPTETKPFTVQYANVEDIQKEVSAAVTKEVGSVRVDKRTKTLIVTDLPHNMAKIQQIVTLFDKRPKQVFIEAKILETTLNDDFSMGINWQQLFQTVNPRSAVGAMSLPGGPATPVGVLNYNTIALNGDLQVVLQALKSVGKTEILSNPNVFVMDGQEAKIEVVEDQPYKEVSLESGTTNVTGVTYQFKKVGVQMGVTPRINDEGMISVAVRPEISSISQWYDGAPQEGTPVIRKALAETSIMVKDGVTIIIGGMIKDRKDETSRSVPILGAIPLLGRLFSYKSTSVVKTEISVSLTPRIVTGDESILLMKDMPKPVKPLRPVGSGFDKTPKPVR